MLKRDWDVTDKISLLDTLDGLQNGGSKAAYQEDGAKLAAMSDSEFNLDVSSRPDKAISTKALRSSYLKWKDRTGLAWDICRSANLVNNAYAARYLTDKEAWDRLLDLARESQSRFSSWQELSDNFLDAREISTNNRDARFEACSALMLDPKEVNSPWNLNPWKTDLSGNG